MFMYTYNYYSSASFLEEYNRLLKCMKIILFATKLLGPIYTKNTKQPMFSQNILFEKKDPILIN